MAPVFWNAHEIVGLLWSAGSCKSTAFMRYCGAIKFSRALDTASSRTERTALNPPCRIWKSHFRWDRPLLWGTNLAATDIRISPGLRLCEADLNCSLSIQPILPISGSTSYYIASLVLPSFLNPYLTFKGTFQMTIKVGSNLCRALDSENVPKDVLLRRQIWNSEHRIW